MKTERETMKDHGVRLVDHRDMDIYCAYLEERIETMKAEILKMTNEAEDRESYIVHLEDTLGIEREPMFNIPTLWKVEGEA